jgi:catechol 2,3-dioxygenase-like lactoylglutathione lyase family enzyme
MSTTPRQVENTIPILPVSRLQDAITFYTGTLGFKLDWGGHDGSVIASVSRDGCALMLSETLSAGRPAWVWIGLEDDSLFHEYRLAGAKVRQEPRNFSWAYEMKFEDPDGNVLWLGTEPRKELPLEDRAPLPPTEP